MLNRRELIRKLERDKRKEGLSLKLKIAMEGNEKVAKWDRECDEVEEWIEKMKNWDFKLTLRFSSDEMPSKAAKYILKKFFGEILSYRRHLVYSPPFIFCFFESNANRVGVHCHVLLHGVKPSIETAKLLKKLLLEATDPGKRKSCLRSVDIDVYCPGKGFARYCAEKMFRKSLDEYDLIPIDLCSGIKQKGESYE
jgi:hypothetical protein